LSETNQAMIKSEMLIAHFEKLLISVPKKDAPINVKSSLTQMQSIDWLSLINKNAYINKKEEESKKDPHSFCSLVDKPLAQSQNITLGICMETLFQDAIATKTDWVPVLLDDSKNKNGTARKNKKGEHQIDHCWMNVESKTIVYAEEKNNINLDTEKSKVTKEKVQSVAAKIKEKYPDYNVKSYILAARYLSASEEIAQGIIKTKYSDASVIGVNDYLELFGLELIPSYEEYKKIIAAVCLNKFNIS